MGEVDVAEILLDEDILADLIAINVGAVKLEC
jgi:hypothetical protein